MKCPQCENEMIKARATSFGPEYDYCRTCKKELAEMSFVSTRSAVVAKAESELMEEFERLTRGLYLVELFRKDSEYLPMDITKSPFENFLSLEVKLSKVECTPEGFKYFYTWGTREC